MGYKATDRCILKAAENEPLFVLRAQDVTSPKVVLHWMAKNWENMPEDRLWEAFECALEMKKWPHRKIPD